MIRLRAVFRVEEEDVAAMTRWLMAQGAIATEIDYDPEES